MAGYGVMTIFVYMRFHQKSGNRKYAHLSFAEYLETGAKDTKSGMNILNEKDT